MILYHTLRAFIIALVLLPFAILSVIAFMIEGIADRITEDRFYWEWLNPFMTYKIVKKNYNSGNFDKITGKRIE